jgi:hypothetical protein
VVASIIALAFCSASEMRLNAELARFPSFNMAMDMKSFSYAHAMWLATRANWEITPNELSDWMNENHSCHDAWSTLTFCHVGGLISLKKRWETLKALKEILGDRAYYEGRMPPPAPIRRFREGPPPPKLPSPPLPSPAPDPVPA